MNGNLDLVFKDVLVRKNRINPPPKPEVESDPSDADDNNNDDDDADDDDRFSQLNWQRVPHLQKRAYEQKRGGKPSWIYLYGWPVWHQTFRVKYWLCTYYHLHQISGGEFNVERATSSAAGHLKQLIPGHGVNKDSKMSSRNSQSSLLAIMQARGVEVSQEVANEMAGAFCNSCIAS
ncbi:hypothetical protein EJ04DRAFT_570652 [Polyplosphaeria fusca]|uniref:Uncharacterized protein n=1 Tax=Polyplosphaeria fusca TaxID=682080 RepID=A0A9P4QLW2_9PLEO|nr:hypothetical protein EJ04DRAFT_570652 [Polyplosphaeria fusca]